MKTKAWYLLVFLTFMAAQRLHAAQNSSLVETKVKTLVVDPNSQAPVVVLETVTDKKLLPIWIAGPEARAIAIALENARLVQAAQDRALRERALSEMSSQIGAMVDFEAILQTAVQEVGKMVGGAEVIIQLNAPPDASH